jgi:hypothetical protein
MKEKQRGRNPSHGEGQTQTNGKNGRWKKGRKQKRKTSITRGV